MCVQIELDLEEESIESLAYLMRLELKEICDECSLSVYDEADMGDFDDLLEATGRTMFNALIVKALRAKIEESD